MTGTGTGVHVKVMQHEEPLSPSSKGAQASEYDDWLHQAPDSAPAANGGRNEGLDEHGSGERGHPAAGAMEDEEDEAVYDEAHQMALIREFGAHPLMGRVQEALYSQLKQTLDRLKGELREVKEEVKRTKDKRETVGVELYGQQQQLARLQVSLESTHEGFTKAAHDRATIEQDLVRQKKQLQERVDECAEKDKQLNKNKQELDALNETLGQVEQYNEEMKNEISVTRRATYKVEEALQQLEKRKKGQDLYIDSLNHQIKRQQEQLTLHEQQLLVQQKETEEADKVLRETAREMELLRFEKKQLMLQWRSSLIGLTKRDEALSAAHEALREAEVAAKDYDTEIDVVKRDILKAQNKNETLVSVHDRLEAETKFVEEQLGKISAEQESMAERYAMLQRSKAETEAEEQRLEQLSAQLRHQIEAITQNIQVVTRERHKVEDDVSSNLNAQSTVSKATRNLGKTAGSVVKQIHDKEIEIANVKNELARIHVDRLNTEAHVAALRSTLEKLDEDLKVKDRLIEKYQLEIRQRNDDIEKKMYRVDRLNKKYQQLVDSAEEPESMGPLESTIKHLHKEIENLEGECLDLQKAWLNDQTQLVRAMSSAEIQTETNSELKARAAILQQQQLRLLQDVKANKEKAKAIEAVTITMHKDIARLNELIGKSNKTCSELQNTNFVTEKEFVEELKRLEAESAEAERKLHEVHTNRANVLNQIIETERQAMLWEKKIELEKETQAALDPEAGMSECRAMEREIHRMRIRLDTLRREQERLVLEMERAIYKHESIALKTNKGKPPAGPGKAAANQSADYTNMSLRKRVKGLKSGLQIANKEMDEFNINIEDRQLRLQDLTKGLETETARYDDIERQSQRLQQEINGLLYQKQRQAEALSRKQFMLKKYIQMETSAVSGPGAAKKVAAEYSAALNAIHEVRRVLDVAKERYGHLDDVLDRVIELSADVQEAGQ